jgi:membrane protein DedA with SNARE-associated domain
MRSKPFFFGRFIALLRIFASPMAGVAQMPWLEFLGVNLAGAAAWATVMTTIAYFVGQVISLEQLIGWVSKFAIVALLVAIGWIAIPIWWERRSAKAGD